MNMKKVLCGVLATSMALSFASVSAFAASGDGDFTTEIPASGSDTTGDTDKEAMLSGIVNGDGEEIAVAKDFSYTINQGSIDLDGINPGQTFYVYLGKNTDVVPIDNFVDDDGSAYAGVINYADIGDSDLFNLKVDKEGNGKSLINSVSIVGDKTMTIGSTSTGRSAWLKVVLNDSPTTSELKAVAELTFKMKSKDKKYTTNKGLDFDSAFESKLNLNMWINNTKKAGADAEADEGDRVYFDPTKNDRNTFIWGDDRAALKFDADSDTKAFYCRLSTKTDNELYSNYGDPVNAELYFYDFVTNSSIPSTSRAVLTLGIPWTDDSTYRNNYTAYQPEPEDCFIYKRSDDGTLVDVTDQFTYSEDAQEIPGWSIQTRVLGTYVLSDTALDVGTINDDVDVPVTDEIAPAPEAPVDTGKNIPNTGSSNMVNVAVAAAIVSLAAAGAVAFKKASK